MPYKLIPWGKGYAVADSSGRKFSSMPLSKETARKQQIAIAISESKKTGKDISKFFD